MFFSKICRILFIIGSTFLIFIPECLYNLVVFLVGILSLEDRRRFFSQSCSILFKIRDSSLLPSSHNYLRLWDILFKQRGNSGEDGKNGERLREKSSSVFKWRRETTPKLLRYSERMKSEEVEATMKMIWNRSWKSIWLMGSILMSHFERIENNSGGIRRVR